jgi:hypothetical protein
MWLLMFSETGFLFSIARKQLRSQHQVSGRGLIIKYTEQLGGQAIWGHRSWGIFLFLGSAKCYLMHFRRLFCRFGILYIIDESITRLRPPPPVSPQFQKNYKIDPEENWRAPDHPFPPVATFLLGNVLMQDGIFAWTNHLAQMTPAKSLMSDFIEACRVECSRSYSYPNSQLVLKCRQTVKPCLIFYCNSAILLQKVMACM